MSHDKSFVERFPSFRSSAPGKVVAEVLRAKHKGRLRALLSAEDPISRGAAQELNRLHKEFFGIDLLE